MKTRYCVGSIISWLMFLTPVQVIRFLTLEWTLQDFPVEGKLGRNQFLILGFSNHQLCLLTIPPSHSFFLWLVLSQSRPWRGTLLGACSGTFLRYVQTKHINLNSLTLPGSNCKQKGDDEKRVEGGVVLVDFNQHRFIKGAGRNKLAKQKPTELFSIQLTLNI